MNNKDFDPSKIKKVPIFDVSPNDYNPKKKNTKEYEQVVMSLRENGLKQPILVRNVNGNYIIVDGEQRYTAAVDLGYEEIYIYDLGDISEDEAKALTIWFEVQVPFDRVALAPIAVELNSLDMELPFTDIELQKFEGMTLGEQNIDTEKNNSGDGFKTLKIRMAGDQFDLVHRAIETVSKNENVSEGRALELLVADGLAGYEQTNYSAEYSEEDFNKDIQ